jgi:hypothetical protein
MKPKWTLILPHRVQRSRDTPTHSRTSSQAGHSCRATNLCAQRASAKFGTRCVNAS